MLLLKELMTTTKYDFILETYQCMFINGTLFAYIEEEKKHKPIDVDGYFFVSAETLKELILTYPDHFTDLYWIMQTLKREPKIYDLIRELNNGRAQLRNLPEDDAYDAKGLAKAFADDIRFPKDNASPRECVNFLFEVLRPIDIKNLFGRDADMWIGVSGLSYELDEGVLNILPLSDFILEVDKMEWTMNSKGMNVLAFTFFHKDFDKR